MTPGTLYGVGVGPGDPELLTLKALRVLQTVPVVFVPTSRPGAQSLALTIAAQHLDARHQRIEELVVEMRDDAAGLAAQWRACAAQISSVLATGADAAYLTEGDPLLYSTFIHLADAVAALQPDAPLVVVPGISSVHAAAAAACIPLAIHDERVALLPATYEGASLDTALESFDTVVLLKVASAIDGVLDALERHNLTDRAVYLRRVGRPEEEIVTDVRTLRGQKLDYFSLMIVRRRES